MNTPFTNLLFFSKNLCHRWKNNWCVNASIFFLVYFLGGFSIFAQLHKVAELEYIKEYGKIRDLSLIPLKEKGALVIFDNTETFGRNSQWEFYKLDSTLLEQWNTKYRPPARMENLLTYTNSEFMYFLFAEVEAEDFVITRINLQLGEVDEFRGKLVGLRTISDFKVLGNSAFFAGNYFDKPVVLSFAFFNATTKVFPGIYDKNVAINSLQIDESRNEINVVINERRKGKCSMSVLSYSYNGDLLRTNHVPFGIDKDLNFVDGKLLSLSEQDSFLAGSFSTNCSSYAKGIFLTKIVNGEEKKTTMVDFSELSSFFGYLSPKRQQRLKEKIAKKKIEGKDLNLSYLLQVHDLIKTNRGVLLIGEIYYYSPNNNNTLGMYTNAPISIAQLQRSRSRAGRYRYTHAIVCEFDKDGTLLWDDAISMGSLEASGLIEQVQLAKYKENWVASYFEKGTLNLQNLNKNLEKVEKETFEIKADEEKNSVDDDAEVASWYDKYYLVWGTRQLPAKENILGSEILYIRKMAYAPTQATSENHK